MDHKNLKALALAAAKAEKNAPVAFSYKVDGKVENFSSSELNEQLRAEFAKLCGADEKGRIDYYAYSENKHSIFRLIAETIDEVLPPRVEQMYSQFAEVKNIAQGDQAIFRLKVTEASRRRAKSFVTRVGLAGRYETFMLDGAEMEVKTGAIGGAAKIGFEEFLDGRWEFSEFTELLFEGLDEFIYAEIARALAAMIEELPQNNKAVVAGFDETTMDELLAIVDTYGKATIFCTQGFANAMVPADAWRYSNEMKNSLWERGYLNLYKGHNVVILPQSIQWGTAEVNSQWVIDPSKAYLIPAGSEKPVKVVFEGQTQVRETIENDDWSHDIHVYTKVGIGTVASLGEKVWIGSYENTELSLDTRS